MHFGLTQDQALLQETLRGFFARALPDAKRRELFDEGRGFDEALWRSAAEVGLPGLLVPQDEGGSALELLDLALAFEVLGEVAAPGPFLAQALGTLALLRGGSPAQRRRWLPRLASGETIAGLALGEGGQRWAPADWGVVFENGHLSGQKVLAEATAETGLLLVGVSGGGLALVDPSEGGVEIAPIDGLDRSRPLAEVRLTKAPAELLEGGGSLAEAVLDAGRVLLAADAFGASWRLIRATVEYALQRSQFGTPIAQFQAVKHQLADMAMEAEPMRGLFWYAAYAFDHREGERARQAATAKAHITERAVQIGRAAVALHGGIGFTWECDVQFWVKRTMHDRAFLGSPEQHRERLARLAGWGTPDAPGALEA